MKFSERKKLADRLWEQWVNDGHRRPETRDRLNASPDARTAFEAGVSMAVGAVNKANKTSTERFFE